MTCLVEGEFEAGIRLLPGKRPRKLEHRERPQVNPVRDGVVRVEYLGWHARKQRNTNKQAKKKEGKIRQQPATKDNGALVYIQSVGMRTAHAGTIT